MSTGFDSSAIPTVRLSSNVMVGIMAVIFSVILVIFFVILYLYAKLLWAQSRARRLRRSRLVFAESDPVSLPRCDLGSAVLEALPVIIFKDSEEELECAVCLCELRDGEQVRMLPKCNHGFHLECIDMWFQSHSNCPLCRSPVEINTTPNSSTERDSATDAVFSLTESSAGFFPANTYIGENRVISAPGEPASSSVKTSVKREGMLVIEIPRLPTEFPWPSTPFPTSETMKTPISSSRRTLTRLLSRGKKTVESFSASPGEGSLDCEQGLRGAAGENWRGIIPRIRKNS